MYNPATVRATKALHERYWEVPRLLGSVVGLRGLLATGTRSPLLRVCLPDRLLCILQIVAVRGRF